MVKKIIKEIFIGSDHAGFRLKHKINAYLDRHKIPYHDLGNLIFDLNDDYPDYAAQVARAVVKNKSRGILICGSAEGVCLAANKIRGARAVNPDSLIRVKMAREHLDANILCLAGGGSRHKQPAVPISKATKMIAVFLSTSFSHASRHIRRINKIKKLELAGAGISTAGLRNTSR
ncbi:MAG TPA: RpiB/LacA/LacB family sugar-phosphate isomerase [Candidatus Nanoarchaeia archaeon]|nr:RpiB/LacA/LacB family sugar-phosphate isomerase [Candidatus Nanoarchaeia archaeon]